jgi:hypothetical protein
MALSGQSLNAATATGPGTAIMFDKPMAAHSLGFVTTGSPDTATVSLEGTYDGTNWFTLQSIVHGTPIGNVGNMPLLGIRGNLTALAGGTSPTVTAWIAAA